MKNISTTTNLHNRFAPYWAGAMILFVVFGIATINFNLGNFWNGYVLDILVPAWNYTLFRGLFTGKKDNAWTRFFTPLRTYVIFITVCLGIEMMQYFKIYDATFDHWDILAYFSLLTPLFVLDTLQYGKEKKLSKTKKS